MLTALITGINGFTGRYLAAELQQAGYRVIGLAHQASATPIPNVNMVYACDLADQAGLAQILEQVQPDVVAHLAAVSFVAHGDVDAIYRSNVVGTRNLLQAIKLAKHRPRAVLLASSANIYGNTDIDCIAESTPPAPANDYAVSKIAMEYVAKLYADDLPLIIVRPFNYTGVGQAPQFLLPKIVGHFARRAPVIELGNLDVSRDFSDVRMVVSAYRRLLETPAAIGGTFNVCSGEAFSLGEVISILAKLSNHELEVRVNPAFVRANEIKILRGDRHYLESVIGPIAAFPLVDTLRWMLEEGEWK